VILYHHQLFNLYLHFIPIDFEDFPKNYFNLLNYYQNPLNLLYLTVVYPIIFYSILEGFFFHLLFIIIHRLSLSNLKF
jgi:hypothetical protein